MMAVLSAIGLLLLWVAINLVVWINRKLYDYEQELKWAKEDRIEKKKKILRDVYGKDLQGGE